MLWLVQKNGTYIGCPCRRRQKLPNVGSRQLHRNRPYRVRVHRKIEDWVEVEAADAAEAERLAINIPGVISVFPRSAMLGDKPVPREAQQGIETEI
jgi:hypothetical protein